MSDTDLFRQTGRGQGVRRLNRVPLLIAGVMLALIIGAVFYTTQMRMDQQNAGGQGGGDAPEPVTGTNIPLPPPPQTKPTLPPPQVVESEPQIEGPMRVAPQPVDPYAREWDRYQQELERMRIARNQVMTQALRAQTPVSNFRGRTSERGAAEEEGGELGSISRLSGQYSSMATAAAMRAEQAVMGATGMGGQTSDINQSARKRSFLGERSPQGQGNNYLQSGRVAPLSPYEIKAGTVIPAVMVGGINSDLPGQILGQVSQDIYDSATGRYILIPQGSKLVGNYDNSTTHGQERVLVAWHRIIYPDSSSVDLGSMPGVDMSGFAGMHDKVNTHFWKMFGSALMLSVLSAGVQLSQGVNNSGEGNDATQTIAAGLGQQMTQLGQTLLERDSQIQPTLEIRQGYNFNVMVTKDMVLRPWTGNRQVGAR